MLKTISYRDIPNFYDRISSKNSKGNLIPFGGNNSLNRPVMFSSAISQIRPIECGEVPLVDTIQSYNIQQSTKNVKIDSGSMRVVRKFEKSIVDHVCQTVSYILYDEDNNTYDFRTIPKYIETGHSYGVRMNNHIEKYVEAGKDIPKGEYITTTNSFNSEMEYQWGVNAVTALVIDANSIEDAGLISDTLSKKMTGWEYTEIDINFDSSNDVLKNLYGNADIYKPLPLPGDEIVNELVYAISKRQKNTQFFKTGYGIDSVSKTDIKAFARGRVVDMDIRQQYGEPSPNSALHFMKLDFEAYEIDILEAMEGLMESDANFTKEFIDKYNFLDAVYRKKMLFKYNNRIYSKKNIHVHLTIVNEIQPICGQKITGRCGNKFTTADVFEDGKFYTGKGEHIEYLGNGLALANRAIMSPPMEMYMNKVGDVIYNYIRDSEDSTANKQKTLKGLLDIFGSELSKVYVTTIFDNWSEFVKDPRLAWYMDSYESGININEILKSFEYLEKRGLNVTRDKLYMKSNEGGPDVYLGEVFVSKLFIAPLKQTAHSQASLRGLGTYDTRGVLIRTDSKRVRDTPVKQSPLVIDILCNSLHPDDLVTDNKLTDQESIQIMNAYLRAMGLELNNPNEGVDD